MASLSRAAALAKEADAIEALYLKLLKFRGACGRRYLLLVEGNDDVTFVDAALARLNQRARQTSATFNCGGKGNVFELRHLLEESAEYSLNDFWFFVDQDFDGMRGHAEDAKTWMTPGYSFENLLVSEAVLEALLKAEYRCNDVNGLKDIENIKTAFADFTLSYKRTLRFANLAAFYAASEDVKVNPHDEVVTPKISVLFPNVILRLTDGEILLKMGKGAPLEEAKVLAKDVDFQKLDAVASWRGKFLLSAFVAFLDYLRKDRGSKNPKQFVKKAKMEFNPRTDPIRTLTSIAELPESLSDFLQTIPSH